MILKIGYFDDDKGITHYKYYENFNSLVIEPFHKNNCYVENEKVFCSDREIRPDYYGFNPGKIKDKLFLNAIWFYDNTTGHHINIVAHADSVFLMNDNGKTVDRY